MNQHIHIDMRIRCPHPKGRSGWIVTGKYAHWLMYRKRASIALYRAVSQMRLEDVIC